MRRAGDVERFQTIVTSDAVVYVHHEVACCDFRHFGDEILGASAFFLGADDTFA